MLYQTYQLLEVVQFRRRKHGNLTRCAQKPVYNAVAVFQSGTLNEIKTWVCWLRHAVAICQLSLVCTFNTQVPGLNCHWHWPPSQKSPVKEKRDELLDGISMMPSSNSSLLSWTDSFLSSLPAYWQCANFLSSALVVFWEMVVARQQLCLQLRLHLWRCLNCGLASFGSDSFSASDPVLWLKQWLLQPVLLEKWYHIEAAKTCGLW